MSNKLYEYKGIMTTFDPSKPEEFPLMKSQVFQSWIDPMKEMMEKLSEANVTMEEETKIKKLEEFFTQHSLVLNRKNIIQIT